MQVRLEEGAVPHRIPDPPQLLGDAKTIVVIAHRGEVSIGGL